MSERGNGARSVSAPLREATLHEYRARAIWRAAMRRFGATSRLLDAFRASTRRVCALEAVAHQLGLALCRDPWESTRVGLPRIDDHGQVHTLTLQAPHLYGRLLALDLPPAVADVLRDAVDQPVRVEPST